MPGRFFFITTFLMTNLLQFIFQFVPFFTYFFFEFGYIFFKFLFLFTYLFLSLAASFIVFAFFSLRFWSGFSFPVPCVSFSGHPTLPAVVIFPVLQQILLKPAFSLRFPALFFHILLPAVLLLPLYQNVPVFRCILRQ